MLAVTNECQDLGQIRGHTNILVDIARAIIEMSALIDEYAKHGLAGE
jgi:hypothetical protein